VGKKNPKVDAYIASSPDFAKPILEHLRAVVHDACPEVEEEMKWSRPHFTYKGMLCGMSAFKEHCAFGFWKGSLILDKDAKKTEDGMGHFGRITKVADLPSKKVLTEYVKRAKKLNDDGVKATNRIKKKVHPELVVPDDLAKALKRNKAAQEAFAKFSPSHKREYVEWITDAKTEATRTRRLETAIEWMAEGKPRNWKYMNC
jgi:uncharacterized protein YdeI (YjbR/CyaY-like superfamily)